jgi:glycine betaine/proline transport system substrate-binding protein
MPGKDGSVRLGRATWDTGWFQAQVFKLLLEELDFTVKDPVTLDNVAFYFFAAQGDIDFWANGWFPLHGRYLEYDKVKGRVRPAGFQVKGGALQGYLIDKTTSTEYGITNLSDLQDPDIAALFDIDGDGKADLIGCNAGWSCEKIIEHHLDAYDLRGSVHHVQGDYSTLMKELINRYRSGAPILYYTWTPNWTGSALLIGEDVMWLSVPFSSLPGDQDADTQVDSVVGCLETPCDMGFGPNDIRVVANGEFLDRNPAAATLFNVVEIPLNDIAAQNARMANGENGEEDIQRHAEEWIEANRDLVEQWLEAARSATQ